MGYTDCYKAPYQTSVGIHSRSPCYETRSPHCRTSHTIKALWQLWGFGNWFIGMYQFLPTHEGFVEFTYGDFNGSCQDLN